jgi:hypothetical protein
LEAADAGEEFFDDRPNRAERLESSSPSPFLLKPNFFIVVVDVVCDVWYGAVREVVLEEREEEGKAVDYKRVKEFAIMLQPQLTWVHAPPPKIAVARVRAPNCV